MSRLRFVGLFATVIACSLNAETFGAPSSAQCMLLTVGENANLGRTLLLEAFNESQNGVRAVALPFNRDIGELYKRPLPSLALELPDIINLYVGELCDDLERLVEQKLIEPLGPLLEEIGVSPDGFLANTVDAVTYKGSIWAIPHRVEGEHLAYNKPLFKEFGIEPSFGSWEELLDAAEMISDAPHEGVALSGFALAECYRPLTFCQTVANTAGGPPLSAVNPRLLVSEEFLGAAQFLGHGERSGAICKKPTWWSLAPNEGMCFTIFIFSESNARCGVLDYPLRLRAGHAAAERSTFRGFLECFALKRTTPAKRAAAVRFFQWLLAEETQLEMVRQSRIEMSPDNRPLRSVHVPLYKPVVEGASMREARASNSDYETLVRVSSKMYFPRNPVSFDVQTYEETQKALVAHLGEDALRDRLRDVYENAKKRGQKVASEHADFSQY